MNAPKYKRQATIPITSFSSQITLLHVCLFRRGQRKVKLYYFAFDVVKKIRKCVLAVPDYAKMMTSLPTHSKPENVKKSPGQKTHEKTREIDLPI